MLTCKRIGRKTVNADPDKSAWLTPDRGDAWELAHRQNRLGLVISKLSTECGSAWSRIEPHFYASCVLNVLHGKYRTTSDTRWATSPVAAGRKPRTAVETMSCLTREFYQKG